jgi:hypothetical protein
MANPEATSSLNTVMMSPWSEDRREDGNGESIVFYPRSASRGPFWLVYLILLPVISALIFIETSINKNPVLILTALAFMPGSQFASP